MNRRATGHPGPWLQFSATNDRRARAAQRVREFCEQLERHIIKVDCHPVVRARVLRAGFLNAYLQALEDRWIAEGALDLGEYEKAANLFLKFVERIPISRQHDKLSNDRLWENFAERRRTE